MYEIFGGGGFVFALRVLPVIVFFSSLIAVLYYLGVMQIVIKVLGGGLQNCWAPRGRSLFLPQPIFSLGRQKRR